MTAHRPDAAALRDAAAIGNYGWLWECASPIIAGTVQKMVRAGEVAGSIDLEDVCQEASAAVGASLSRWDARRGAFTTWVTVQTRGAVLDYVNREANRGTAGKGQRVAVVSMDADIAPETALREAATVTGSAPVTDPEALTAARDAPDLSAIRDPLDRELFRARLALDGGEPASIDALARLTGLSTRTVKRRLRKAYWDLTAARGRR